MSLTACRFISTNCSVCLPNMCGVQQHIFVWTTDEMKPKLYNQHELYTFASPNKSGFSTQNGAKFPTKSSDCMWHTVTVTNCKNWFRLSIEITNRCNCMQWILFLCLVHSTCFGRHTRPSSGVQLYLQPLVQSYVERNSREIKFTAYSCICWLFQ